MHLDSGHDFFLIMTKHLSYPININSTTLKNKISQYYGQSPFWVIWTKEST